MRAIPGFQLSETLHASPNSLVFRGHSESDGRPVVVKVCAEDDPSARASARLEREYELGRSVHGTEEIVEYLDLVPLESSVALVLEDFGGRSAEVLLADGPFDVAVAVDVGLQITRALGALHTAGIVHRNVAPSNVIYEPDSGRAKLGDLGIALRIPRSQQEACSPSHLEGTLAYIAPAGDDPMALVHAHVAIEPSRLHEICPGVPESLSMLVAKLMAKSAERRYQSARGLEDDLARCAALLSDSGDVEIFELGASDVPTTLCVSQELYGREDEIEALLGVFTRVADGGCELLLVRGQPGIGKSVLVHEVQRPIVERRGYFGQGKFDQLEMALPLSAVKQALGDLVRQVLTESEQSLADWGRRLRDALGDEARVLVEQLPELHHVIGHQPEVIELGPREAQERFDRLLLSFLHEFATAEHPLVLFIDDLQWVDAASLRLLQQLVTHQGSHHLLVIGSYRDTEVGTSHPLSLALATLEEGGANITAIDLGPLSEADVEALVADSIDCEAAVAEPLSALVHQKAGGNPFFVTQLLQSLYDDGLLTFSPREGRWVWDMDRIRALEVVGNAVELMVAKILRYDEAAQRQLRLGSSLGGTFDLETLAIISDLPPREAAQALWEPLRDGLVLPLDNAYRYYQWGHREHESPPPAVEVRYAFAHDRIQEAAYSQIPEADRPEVHLRIGRLLLERASEEARGGRVFDLANHFNAGLELLADPAERLKVAELNLAAAREARTATAYAEARDYVIHGIDLLPADAWDEHYDLTFALHRERVDCEFLSGDLETAEAVFADVSRKARTREHVGDIYQLMIRICHTADEHARGLALGQECLELFDVDLPNDPDAAQAVMAEENERIAALLGDRDVGSFIDHRLVEDPDMEICLGLLHETWTCAVMSGDFQQWTLTALKIVRLSLEHGHCKFSPCGYVAHAAVLALTGDHLRARDYGELAVALCHKFEDPFIIPKVHNTYANFTNHLVHHIESNVTLYEESYRNCLLSGDRWWGSWAVGFVRIGKLLKGDPVPDVLETARRFHDYIASSGYTPLALMSEADVHVAMNLLGLTDSPSTLSAGEYREESAIADLRAIEFGYGLYYLHLNKAWIHLLNREIPAAWDAIRRAEETRDAIPGTMGYPDWFFYDTLIRAAHHGELEVEAQQGSIEAMDADIEQMRAWEKLCAANFQHRRALMEAERRRIMGEGDLGGYEEAIAAARENRFLHHEALANELAGRFCLERGWTLAGMAYLRRAHRRYARWGGAVKVVKLSQEFPGIEGAPRPTVATDTTATSHDMELGRLDIGTVMKAAQAISGELVLSRLLARLLEICVENAGAQKGILLVQHDGELFIEAQTGVDAETELPHTPLADSADLPTRVVQYVQRTRGTVVLADAAASELYGQDPYIDRNGVCSILCVPVRLREGRLAILYLENDLTTGVFTPERVELLQMLAAQAATSLENAQLYDTLEQKVADRTRELAEKNEVLQEKNQQIILQQTMLIQSEKMASLGQLVAGVAHEINNPINFISGGLPSLERDLNKLVDLTPEASKDERL
ncbi:MAG: AAA family ATPase, partial [Gemmatimonadota bacterium]